MATMLGRGQCGGHLSLFFTIEDCFSDLLLQGSRGAGICIQDGVEAIARGEEGKGLLQVKFLGREYDGSLYQFVLEELVDIIPEVGKFDWELGIRMVLPSSQGFGMSASGAVASAIAFQRAIGIPHEECLRRSFMVAHIVERKRSSGLGDTTALSAGGVERRVAAGSPYSGSLLKIGPGKSEGWYSDAPILLCWRKKTGTHTSRYIDDIVWKRRISEAGKLAMEGVGAGDWESHRWTELIEASRFFASESGLDVDASRADFLGSVDDAIRNSIFSEELTPLLCMLGESVVIVPNNLQFGEGWIKHLSELLESSEISTFPSRISQIR